MQQLVELHSLLPDASDDATQILAISIDSHEESQKLVQRWDTLVAKSPDGTPGNIEFPLLEDNDSQVIKRYGLLNPQGKGWPHPATYVIDKQGIVRWKFIEVDYKVRPTNAMILEALKTVPPSS